MQKEEDSSETILNAIKKDTGLDRFFVKTHEIRFYFPIRLADSNSLFDILAPLGQAAVTWPVLRRSSC
tara:strand:+ start:466 stop:669 length:204 start_codon:yes stop_codon:yes gene_type:complete